MLRAIERLIEGDSPPRARTAGQGAAEFALVLPVLLLLVFVIIALGRLLHAWLAVENGARFAVRYAATGEFDPTYNTQAQCDAFYLPYGIACDTDNKRENAARVLSIHDQAVAGAAAILRDESKNWDEPGFFNVGTCSTGEDPQTGVPFVTFLSDPNNWTTDWSSRCEPYPSAGLPGSRVIVMVDFNHPIIVPFLSTIWPWLHLTAQREVVVEQFRVSRIVGLDPTLVLPSPTPLPTNTPTNTYTPLPTNTPLPTATSTETPTITPTPDCNLISVRNIWVSGNNLNMQIQNDNPADIQLTSAFVDWHKQYANQRVWAFWFGGARYTYVFDSFPPSSSGASSPRRVSPGGVSTFSAQFTGVEPPGLVGDMSVALTFDGRCSVSSAMAVSTPLPSNTPTATDTPTITPTPSNTPLPTATWTPTITNTPTPVTPTNTPTPVTPTRTPTPVTPTNTPTPRPPTNTPAPVTPTLSPTPTQTATFPPFD